MPEPVVPVIDDYVELVEETVYTDPIVEADVYTARIVSADTVL